MIIDDLVPIWFHISTIISLLCFFVVNVPILLFVNKIISRINFKSSFISEFFRRFLFFIFFVVFYYLFSISFSFILFLISVVSFSLTS